VKHRLAVPLLLVLLSLPAWAEPLPRDRVPEPLRPWTDWALRGQEGLLCPYFLGSEDENAQTRCAWPGRLTLDLGEKGGTFSQVWTVEAAEFVPLPGDERRWPLDLMLDGQPAAAVAKNEAKDEVPGLWLAPGRHSVTGSFRWDALPEALPVPSDVGLVALTVRGAAVPFPQRGDGGEVFLQRAQAAPTEAESLEIVVQRRVIDEVPLLLVTRIQLAVSGKAREVLLGRALPAGFIPLALDGPLPARLEPDGRLRVQVRPGTWTLELTARHEGPAAALTLPPPGGPWAQEEVWVFDARPALRIADVEGVPAVDPQQTQLPDDWKSLPAYRLRPGETMKLAERRRGDADPAADKLTLHRVLWLDFDGGGYTWQDQLAGTLTRSWRLEMPPPSSLQRVVIAGKDQVITRRSKAGGGAPLAGVEVRQGQVLLGAEGRVPGRLTLPAVGWDHDFQQVSGELHLPPGWKILGATGVDQVPGTWLSLWTLLDLFLVLIIALAVRHLWGNRWGLLALAAMVLTWQEAEAPRWIWLAVLAAAALLRLLPGEGRFRTFVRLVWAASLIGLVLITVAFLVQQIRQAIYPALEYPYSTAGQETEVPDRTAQLSLSTPSAPPAAEEPMAKDMAQEAPAAESESSGSYSMRRAAPPPPPPPPPKKAELQEIDPRAVVNTGPGLPVWQWNQVTLRWSGPVDKDQRVRFFLLSPAVSFLLTFVRAALLVLLVLRLLGVTSIPPVLRRPSAPAAAALLLILLAALLAPGRATAQTPQGPQVPPQDVLDKLRAALTEKPACHPHCAASPRLFVDVAPAELRLRFEVGAAAAVAVPIPGGVEQWVPAEVQIDGAPAGVVRSDDGQLWVRVSPGRHEIQESGPLPQRDVVQIPLPLKPHHAEASASGWTVDGIHEDGEADESLQLTRVRGAAAGASAGVGALQPGELPPFLEVERTLHLGLTWQVETSVSRRSPVGTPAVVAVPLLPGEQVTTAGVRVQKGTVLVNLGPQSLAAAWTSTLEPRPEIVLTAPRTLAWTEVWKLDASPIWHFEAQGIPAVHGDGNADVRVPEWRPWPGETVKIAVSRPEGIAGQSLTIDRSSLQITPGLRSTEARLDLSIRSSRGGRHTVVLPEKAELTAVTIDGQEQPIRQEGRQVALPIHPGAQKIALTWREARGASFFFRTPDVDLKNPSVNALLSVENPASRWILLLGGPRLGPAVLFWSLLLVIVLVAVGLARLPLTPLKTRDWVLLGIGLSQVPLLAAAMVAGWLLALGARRRKGPEIERNPTFDLLQVLLAFWTLLSLGILFWAIRQGLLGVPEMQIEGNGSYASALHWYTDRAGGHLPTAWVISVPLLVYRLAMLAWALWLALALLRWLRWGWESVTAGGGWRPWRPSPPPLPAPPAPSPGEGRQEEAQQG
jgi:hypothetical protein